LNLRREDMEIPGRIQLEREKAAEAASEKCLASVTSRKTAGLLALRASVVNDAIKRFCPCRQRRKRIN